MSYPTSLEAFNNVLGRQEPLLPGKPIDMTCFSNVLPKNCGDPWRGAYSKHGFWYRIYKGNQEDYEKIVAMSFEQESCTLRYEDFETWEKCYDAKIFVAKHLKHEVLGGIVVLKKTGYHQVAAYFVQQEYRHSGIGCTLFTEATKNCETIVINAMHHLHDSLSQFRLKPLFGREIMHYKLDKPTGFTSLEANYPELNVKSHVKFLESDLNLVCKFDQKISGEDRPIRAVMNGDDITLSACFKENTCIGYGIVREAAGGTVKRIVAGPIYAENANVAEFILSALLKKYYNPDEDFDFDPDVNAIYRRELHFCVPRRNDHMINIMEKLQGSGSLQKMRLWYQTASSGTAPGAQLDSVYAFGDIHSSLV